MFCPPGGNVFLITACVPSYLHFFLSVATTHAPKKGCVGAAAVDAISRWMFLSSGASRVQWRAQLGGSKMGTYNVNPTTVQTPAICFLQSWQSDIMRFSCRTIHVDLSFFLWKEGKIWFYTRPSLCLTEQFWQGHMQCEPFEPHCHLNTFHFIFWFYFFTFVMAQMWEFSGQRVQVEKFLSLDLFLKFPKLQALLACNVFFTCSGYLHFWLVKSV